MHWVSDIGGSDAYDWKTLIQLSKLSAISSQRIGHIQKPFTISDCRCQVDGLTGLFGCKIVDLPPVLMECFLYDRLYAPGERKQEENITCREIDGLVMAEELCWMPDFLAWWGCEFLPVKGFVK